MEQLNHHNKFGHLFARVHWFEKHPCQEVLPYPLNVFATLTKIGESSTFLPISRIMSCCAVCDTSVKFDFGTDHVLLLCPTNKKIPSINTRMHWLCDT